MSMYPGDPSNRTEPDQSSLLPWLVLLIAVVGLVLAAGARLV